MSFYGEGMNMNLDDIDDEEVWINPPFDAKNALHAGLSDFEQTLRCPICCELLHVPVSIQPCQHSFCSECIQSHVKAGLASLKREAKCPVCRQLVPRDMKCLVPNRTVETLVRQYKGLRNGLKEALAKEATNVLESSPKMKRCRTTRSDMTSPVRALDVAPSTVEVTELRKKLPTTHYKGMNRIKLVELCKHDGLSTHGDAAALKARHQAFVSLYNSECDSFTPRSAQQIAQEIHRRETAKKVNTKIMQFLLYMVLGSSNHLCGNL
jgi:E3 ubiquitin-protein ligase RAD18